MNFEHGFPAYQNIRGFLNYLTRLKPFFQETEYTPIFKDENSIAGRFINGFIPSDPFRRRKGYSDILLVARGSWPKKSTPTRFKHNRFIYGFHLDGWKELVGFSPCT